MFKTRIYLNVVIPLLVVDLVIGVVIGVILGATVFAPHASSAIPHPPVSQAAPLTTVTIPQGQDLFEPFILPVEPNTAVTWQNDDTVAHTFTTTPDQSNFLNLAAFSLQVAAGQHVTFTFKQPGLYHYYETTVATWNTADARVAPKQGVPHFPMAMDGIIWVQGSISNLPSGATNHIPTQHDDFETEFVAVNQGGTLSMHNLDTDPHVLALVSGWSGPINPAEIGINRIGGTGDVPGGETITIPFNLPGLYYYYCVTHAQTDSTQHRAAAIKGASEYPIPMEGFVLVVGY